MKIDTINNISFGTYLGLNLQEKILLAKERNILSKENLQNLAKIEDDGLNTVLDISDTYQIIKQKNGKSAIFLKKYLSLSIGKEKVNIDDLKTVYEPTQNNKNIYFRIHKFIKMFNNDFNLAEKIKHAFENLAE